jgi:hypothetical protein
MLMLCCGQDQNSHIIRVEPVGPFAGKKYNQKSIRFQRAQPAQLAKPDNLKQLTTIFEIASSLHL